MTDRELLEAAAEAVGIVLDTAKPGDVSDKNCHARVWDRSAPVRILFYSDSRDHPMCRKPSQPGNVEWNPLTDDGDALRLAVALNISLWISPGNVVTARFRYEGEVTVIAGTDLGAPNKNAAVRRAIVRAAAQIGRAASSRAGDGI